MHRFDSNSEIPPQFILRVHTGLKAGNCYADCNEDLGVCLSGPSEGDPFALGINCQADYDQCVDQCMA
jgi:hypothetical protein